MKKLFSILILIFAGIIVFPCTTVTLQDSTGNIIYGRNFDFPVGYGHVTINQRQQKKTASIMPPEQSITWISKYGSITFNQYGREFPYGGMNEAGLVIEQMWLQETEYPQLDNRYGLRELQWIQYQLDNSKTVQEVIDSDTLVRISFISVAPLHFLVSDINGDVATIEYLDGKMVFHRGENLPYTALANCPYERSLNYKKQLDKNSEESFSDWTVNSLGRFSIAATMAEAYDHKENIIDYTFSILDNVSQGSFTQWSIVYDVKNQEIYYKTHTNTDIRKIGLKEFNFSCGSDNIYIDIHENFSRVSDFQRYNFDDNLRLIQRVCNEVEFLKNSVPEEARIYTARYPESVVCGEN